MIYVDVCIVDICLPVLYVVYSWKGNSLVTWTFAASRPVI